MERWREIPGYENLYEASDLGNIRTCYGKTTSSARFQCRVWKQRIMKQKYQTRRSGHGEDARITLWKDGKEHTHLVARLVALTWCQGYFDGATVNHIDGNPLNNCASNLEWVSLGENIRAGFEMGLFSSQKPCVLTDAYFNDYHFKSMAEAGRFIGRDCKYISGCIKRGSMIATAKNGERYSISGGR